MPEKLLKEMRIKSQKELIKEIKDLKKKLFDMKRDLAFEKLKKTSDIKKTKKQIAQVNTILVENITKELTKKETAKE